jgi:hypothetical protein
LWSILKEVFAQKQFIGLEMTGMLAEFTEGLRKTCVAIYLQTCHQLQEVTPKNSGHTKHILTKKTTQMLSNMYEVCR